MNADIEQIARGHPSLLVGGYLPIRLAGQASGLGVDSLLREAANGHLNLYVYAVGLLGYQVPLDVLKADYSLGGEAIEVPPLKLRPESAHEMETTGMLRIREASVAAVAQSLASNVAAEVLMLLRVDRPDVAVAPEQPLSLTVDDLQVSVSEVESIRGRWKAALPVSSALPPLTPFRATGEERRVSEAIDAYMKVRAMGCSSDQARRIRSALDMFAELVGDPCLSEITDRTLDEYRDSILPLVPAAENLVRSQFKTSNVRESIRAIEGTSAERISAAEQVKRLKWLAAMFAWLKMKEWISRDPSLALVVESGAAVEVRKAKGRDQDARELFTRADLQQIFSAGPWFRTGRGERTKSGTYREFSPHYYWLPLIALYTGARINELAQLSLSDLCLGSDGLWSIRIAELDDLEEKKKRKNAYSRRLVPVHPKLEDLGLIRWRHALAKRGYRRLFPELKHDAIKGYGKAPTKWFSAYLGRLGWARDGRKTFHSFRSTLVSECVNRLKLTPVETAHISGHARPNDDAISGYIKDQVPAALLLAVQRLDFELPSIAVFDIEAGVDAVADALARKNAGRGGVED